MKQLTLLTVLLLAPWAALHATDVVNLRCEYRDNPLAADETAGRELQSSMIWASSAPAGTQAYVAFRKSFELKAKPEQPARLDIFADSRYLLWVNGEQILRGPCRFNPKRPEFDSLDVTPFLRPGKNVLTVLVHHYAGAVNGRIMRHAPGLTARLAVGGKEILRTDTSWRCSKNTEYQFKVTDKMQRFPLPWEIWLAVWGA